MRVVLKTGRVLIYNDVHFVDWRNAEGRVVLRVNKGASTFEAIFSLDEVSRIEGVNPCSAGWESRYEPSPAPKRRKR